MMLDKPIANNSISSFWFPTMLRTKTKLFWVSIIVTQLNLLLLVSNTVENQNQTILGFYYFVTQLNL